MAKNLTCPFCGGSHITITDNEPLAHFNDREEAKKSKYFLDKELYAEMRCWDCLNTFKTTGDIQYKQPAISIKITGSGCKTDIIRALKDFIVEIDNLKLTDDKTFENKTLIMETKIE